VFASKGLGQRGDVLHDVLVAWNGIKDQNDVVETACPEHFGHAIAGLFSTRQFFLNLGDRIYVGQQVLQAGGHKVAQRRKLAGLDL